MDGHNDLLGELAADAALERSDFIVQATEQLRRFLDHHKDRIAVARRPDAHRRGARLPVDRAGPDVPQPQPLPRRRDRRVGQRDRGHRVRLRAGRALQPGRHLRRVRRGRPRGRRDAGRADRRGRPPRGCRDLARGGRLARRGSVRRRRRLVGGRPADLARPRTTTSRPRAGCTTSRSNTRSAASAARRACSRSSRARRPGWSRSSAT